MYILTQKGEVVSGLYNREEDILCNVEDLIASGEVILNEVILKPRKKFKLSFIEEAIDDNDDGDNKKGTEPSIKEIGRWYTWTPGESYYIPVYPDVFVEIEYLTGKPRRNTGLASDFDWASKEDPICKYRVINKNIEVNINTWKEPITGMEFVWVPEGGGFWIGKYPVTQGQWKKIMGNNPSRFEGENNPVESVSWEDCLKFIEHMNDLNKGTAEFSLPREEQWEVAANGGESYRYAGSNNIDEVAWYVDNSNKTTHPVGLKKPNSLGIYDMSGNVWEWCEDLYDKKGPKYDRVIRGGSWNYDARYCRSAFRSDNSPGCRSNDLGFRLVRR